MSTIFISYRRDDSAAACGRIYERLASYFGRDTVFKDVDDLPYGVRFPDYLAEQLRGCRIELVMIGRYWLTLTTPDGTRRLDAPGDFVRTEVEMGLRDGLIVVPVLVDNASMPHPEDLPESIRELVEYNGAPVRNDPDFNPDMQRLIRQLERWLGVTPPSPPPAPVGASGGRPPAPLAPPAPADDPAAARVRQATPLIESDFAARDWPQVLDRCRYLATATPDAADTIPARLWLLYGQACLEDGATQEGRTALDRALRQTPDDLETLRAAARACHTLGDDAAAETHLVRALGRPVHMTSEEQMAVLRDYLPVLLARKNWDEALRRATQGSRLAPENPTWPRWQLEALDHLNRPADALAVLRIITARPDATVADWLDRAFLARKVGGESVNANQEIADALRAAERLDGPGRAHEAAILATHRELFPPPPPPAPPIAPEYFPERLASLGFAPRTGKDPQTGKEAAFILPPTVPVPAGSFQMGKTNPRDPDAGYDGPARTATTGAFAIARYPVTVAEYACFVRAGQQEPKPGWAGSGKTLDWRTQLQRLDHPVTCVSWHDAVAYAEWLARLSGQPWRLPTEEEWEKAARWDPRSGASRIYPWGDTFDQNRCNTSESKIDMTTPVGKYGASGASPVGAEDMAGNVWEWTSLPYDSSTDNRVLRGGSWSYDHQIARAAYRVHDGPDVLNGYLGFRLVVAPVRAGS